MTHWTKHLTEDGPWQHTRIAQLRKLCLKDLGISYLLSVWNNCWLHKVTETRRKTSTKSKCFLRCLTQQLKKKNTVLCLYLFCLSKSHLELKTIVSYKNFVKCFKDVENLYKHLARGYKFYSKENSISPLQPNNFISRP